MYSKCLLLASLLIVANADETKTTASGQSSSQFDIASSESNTATTSKVALKDALKASESNSYVRKRGHEVNIVITDKGSTLDIRPQEGYTPRVNDYATKGGGGDNYQVDQYGRGGDGGHQDADYGNYGQGGGYDQEPQPAYGERVPTDKGNGGYYNADVHQQQPVQQPHGEPHYNDASQAGYAIADKQAEHAYGANQVGHSSAGYANGPAYDSYAADGKDAGGQYQVLPANDQYSQNYDNGASAGYANDNGYGNGEVKQIVADYGNGGHAIQAPAPAPAPVADYGHQQHQPQQYQNGGDYAANGNGQNVQEYKAPLANEPKYDYGGFRPIVKQELQPQPQPQPQYVTNNGYDRHQGNAYPTGGHTAKVILIPAQEVLPPKNGGQFQYQTNLDHSVKTKQNDVPDAGHIVDYASGKPYGGNLAEKPYSTDYVSGLKTAVAVKETYDNGAYVQQKPTYSTQPTGYTLPISADLTNGYANQGYSTSNIIKGPMIGTNYDVNIDALLSMNTIPLSHGSGYGTTTSHGGSASFGGSGSYSGAELYGGSHHSPAPIIKSTTTPHGSYESSFAPGGLTSSFNPSLGSGFYAAASAPSFSSHNYGSFGLGSYSTPDVTYSPPMNSPPPMYTHPVYSGMPKFGSFADYTTAADTLLSGTFDNGFGRYTPKFGFGSSKGFPSFRGAYNSVYGYAAASNRIPFVLKAPSSLKNMVKALTGSV